MNEATENIRGTIRYYKIEEKNPKITLENPIVDPYFSVLKSGARVVYNGWIC